MIFRREEGWQDEREIRIALGPTTIAGTLSVPERPRGAVLFAHGSGSSRWSPRHRAVARILGDAGFATLLLDLMTPDEERRDAETAELRSDAFFLAHRLVAATDWLGRAPATARLPLGYFGASTGTAAAPIAAVERPERVRAIVSRGGRPELAGPSLALVRAPTLLIVGGADVAVITLNRRAVAQMRPGVDVSVEIVPGATHAFEERGALDAVARLARDWFARHLPGAAAGRRAG
jgi:dienelactone hydrolase